MADSPEFDLFGRPIEAEPKPEYSHKNKRQSRHRELQRAAHGQALPLIQKVIQQALNGDMYAARLILDRVWPRPRTAPVALDMPAARTPAELRAQMYSIAERVHAGELTTDDGAALIAMARDILESQSIQTLDSGPKTVTIDARRVLGEKLARIAASRPAGDEPEEQTA